MPRNPWWKELERQIEWRKRRKMNGFLARVAMWVIISLFVVGFFLFLVEMARLGIQNIPL